MTLWRKISDNTLHMTITATGTYEPVNETGKSYELECVMASAGQSATVQLKMGRTDPIVNGTWTKMVLDGVTKQTMSDPSGRNVVFGLARVPVLVVSAISGTLTATMVDQAPVVDTSYFIFTEGSTVASESKYQEFRGATLTSQSLPSMVGSKTEYVFRNSGSSILSLNRNPLSAHDTLLSGANTVTMLSLNPGYSVRIFDAAAGRGMDIA
jgi:hypothetical protein